MMTVCQTVLMSCTISSTLMVHLRLTILQNLQTQNTAVSLLQLVTGKCHAVTTDIKLSVIILCQVSQVHNIARIWQPNKPLPSTSFWLNHSLESVDVNMLILLYAGHIHIVGHKNCIYHFYAVIMVALCNRADHYIFILFLLLFFARLISAVGDWMFTILWHMVWP